MLGEKSDLLPPSVVCVVTILQPVSSFCDAEVIQKIALPHNGMGGFPPPTSLGRVRCNCCHRAATNCPLGGSNTEGLPPLWCDRFPPSPCGVGGGEQAPYLLLLASLISVASETMTVVRIVTKTLTSLLTVGILRSATS